ncbi:TonB-dependent receptor [Pseudoduganella sp. UC29_106]|uniref:TonB-dependent receptor n=1 Tax=Pseudoduganella sp. UC29_106 TaxID=3374553 RepID=UPI003758278E
MQRSSFLHLAVTAALTLPLAASANDAAPLLQQITVTAGHGALLGVADSAGEGTLGAGQLAGRPLLRAAEVLETVPGMIVTQHSGDGKANQYFLRGFNLDHGSDFATSVAGVPVNIVSHAHGQGYMDLNFLIPELVASVRYRKGVYAAEDGDFATTGTARIDYQRRLDAPLAELAAGPHGFRRALLAGSSSGAGPALLGALELAENNGPWDQPERLRKANGLLRWSEGSSANGYALTAQAYRSRWDATEHVPERAIDSGEIGRFGALSGGDGGETYRYNLSGQWARDDDAGALRLAAYLVHYGLNLFSSASGFIGGPEGDQHEQEDRRNLWGGEIQRSWQAGPHEVTAGLQLRHDRAGTLGLYTTVNRQRTGTVRQDRLRETEAAAFAELRSSWTSWLRTTLGLRQDHIRASTTATGGVYNLQNGGDASASQTSPKLAIVLAPSARTELYANWGYGFHSNDGRGATSKVNPADGSPAEKLGLFARANGAELGLRTEPLPGWTSSVTLWRLALASELVFVGDEGVTEPRGASRRRGVEWSNYFRPRDGIVIDADLALSRARFKEPVEGGGDRVPNAIPFTASLGVSADPGGRWFGGLHARYIGAYALEETGRERSHPLFTTNIRAGYRFSRSLQLSADILNLFNRAGNDIEYSGRRLQPQRASQRRLQRRHRRPPGPSGGAAHCAPHLAQHLLISSTYRKPANAKDYSTSDCPQSRICAPPQQPPSRCAPWPPGRRRWQRDSRRQPTTTRSSPSTT